MGDSRITELMAKQIGKSATQKESEELANLLSENPSYAHLYEIIHSLKGGIDHLERNIPKEELVNHGWQDLADKLNTEPENNNPKITVKKEGLLKQLFINKPRWAAASVFIFCICTVLGYYKIFYLKTQVSPALKIAEVHNGGTSKIILADGTQVWINAGSRLIYPEVFATKKREVTLEGEAFFEVTKNPHWPFLVHAGKITVKVLGTRFNVKAYKEDADIQTTLISGRVQVVLNDDPDKQITLSPHEKLTVINPVKSNLNKEAVSNELRYQVQELPATVNNSFIETAWLDNKLVLNNDDFENVAHMLERKYNVHIYFNDTALKQERVTGVFEKEDIQQVLDVLKMTTGFTYKMEGNTIRLF